MQTARRLVDAGEHGTAGGHLDAVLMPAGIGDHGHLVCKAVHSLLDGGFVVKGTGAHFEPCGVQRAFKGSCDGVCRGGREVLSCAAGREHSDSSTVWRMYAHANEESIRRVGQTVREALKEPEKKKHQNTKTAL